MRDSHLYEVKQAIEACHSHDVPAGHESWRSQSRQWDYIIGTVCLGCGKLLGRYEELNRLAWCYSCRRILFPETTMRRSRDTRRGPASK
jgi:hypothetical protein